MKKCEHRLTTSVCYVCASPKYGKSQKISMTRDDIIAMARGAGGSDMEPYDYGAKPDRMILFYDELVSLAYKIAAAEREACARILDSNSEACRSNSMLHDVLVGNALAIRAKGKE